MSDAPRFSPSKRDRLIQALAYWGFWPCAVMVLAQAEAAALAGREYPRQIMLWTVAGTLSVYGLDRLAERRSLTFTAVRHRAQDRIGRWMPVPISIVALSAIPGTGKAELLWLTVLGVSGLAYLAVTVNFFRCRPLLKELLGAWCFTYLVWGMFAVRIHGAVVGMFLLGLANFCWSSRQDRARDEGNGIASLAVKAPGLNLLLARGSALLAAAFFFNSAGWASPFLWTALAHGAWPGRTGLPIDLAFLPLAAYCFRLLPIG